MELKKSVRFSGFIVQVHKAFIGLGGNTAPRVGDTWAALPKLRFCTPSLLNWVPVVLKADHCFTTYRVFPF